MRMRIFDALLRGRNENKKKHNRKYSFLHQVATGSLYKISNIRSDSDISDIKTQIDTMRALARDAQISTALSYYATDATTTNTKGQIIWATSEDEKVSQLINDLFLRWDINSVARDHILELATIGNLYIPTTMMYKPVSKDASSREHVAIDNNTLPDKDFDIITSYKVPPEEILHIYLEGEPCGYIYDPEEDSSNLTIFPESAVIHFSLGGLLGDYSISLPGNDGTTLEYDIKFAQPLMEKAVQPTQVLNLLEDAVVLSSLSKVIRFISIDLGDTVEEEEVEAALADFKSIIEQQLSLNTSNGDAQSYVNPQSPNNLIYLSKVHGQEPISITDLNMQTDEDSQSGLLQYYQDKKLSVLGVPKEAMNFSSNEGLGGAGSVLSQRSALYANSLQRLETAYMEGWRKGLNTYFAERGFSGYIDNFELHMNPIITTQSTIQFDKRDAALAQAQTFVQLLKDLGVENKNDYISSLIEILSEVFPQMGAEAAGWSINPSASEGGEL